MGRVAPSGTAFYAQPAMGLGSRVGLLALLLSATASAQAPTEAPSAAESGSETETEADAEAEAEADAETEAEAETDAEPDAEAETDAEPEAETEAEAEAEPEPQGSVAVLMVAATEDAREAADGLTEVLIGAVALRGAGPIVGKEELQSLLSQAEERTLECVTSPACLGRVSVQLGVREAIVGTLSHNASTWSFQLNRIDARAGQVLGSAFREIEGELGEVASAVLDAVPEVYMPPVRPAQVRISVNVPATIYIDDHEAGRFTGEALNVELEAGTYLVRAEPESDDHRPWSRRIEVSAGANVLVEASLDRVVVETPIGPIPDPPSGISSLVWVGTAVGAVGALGALTFGVRSQRTIGGDPNRAEALAFVEDRERDALLANIGFGVIAIGVGITVVGLLLSEIRGSRIAPTASASRHGAMVGIGGEL